MNENSIATLIHRFRHGKPSSPKSRGREMKERDIISKYKLGEGSLCSDHSTRIQVNKALHGWKRMEDDVDIESILAKYKKPSLSSGSSTSLSIDSSSIISEWKSERKDYRSVIRKSTESLLESTPSLSSEQSITSRSSEATAMTANLQEIKNTLTKELEILRNSVATMVQPKHEIIQPIRKSTFLDDLGECPSLETGTGNPTASSSDSSNQTLESSFKSTHIGRDMQTSPRVVKLRDAWTLMDCEPTAPAVSDRQAEVQQIKLLLSLKDAEIIYYKGQLEAAKTESTKTIEGPKHNETFDESTLVSSASMTEDSDPVDFRPHWNLLKKANETLKQMKKSRDQQKKHLRQLLL